MFDGKVRGIRPVSLVGKNPKADSKSAKDLVENARKQREARAAERLRSGSVIKIQKVLRSKLTRLRYNYQLRSSFDSTMQSGTDKLLVLGFLPKFFRRSTDKKRLLDVNEVIKSMLNNSAMGSITQNGRFLLGSPLFASENTILRRLVACLALSLHTITGAFTEPNTITGAEPIEELLSFLDAIFLSESIPGVLRVVLAMLLVPQSSQAFRMCSSDSRNTRASTSNPAVTQLWSTYKRLLTQLLNIAVNWVKNDQLSQEMVPEQKTLLLPYRQVR